MNRFWHGIALLLCACGSSAHAAEFSQMGPQASAAQFITARGHATGPVLRLTFRVSGGENKTPSTMIVDIAPDYVFTSMGATGAIYDYKFQRIVQLNQAAHTFRNDSLYALVDFLRAETYNRRVERGMLAAAKLQDPTNSLDPYWVQSELHVMDSADPMPDIAQSSATDGSVRFVYGGNGVAEYVLSDQSITAAESKRFAQFLAQNTSLHPHIIDALIATHRLPQRLSFAPPPREKGLSTAWQLLSANRVTDVFPLTDDFALEPLDKDARTSSSSGFATTVDVMLAATAGKARPARRSIEDFRNAIEGALQQKAGLQAMLLAFEGIEQYGQQSLECTSTSSAHCRSLKDVFTESEIDPRSKMVVQALGVERTDLNQAIQIMRSIQHADISNDYVIDDFLGNMLDEAGKTDDALPLLMKAVRGNPYSAGYYKDMGDAYRESFNPDPAWICYDLGRSLAGGSSAPVINKITDYEAQLIANYSMFF